MPSRRSRRKSRKRSQKRSSPHRRPISRRRRIGTQRRSISYRAIELPDTEFLKKDHKGHVTDYEKKWERIQQNGIEDVLSSRVEYIKALPYTPDLESIVEHINDPEYKSAQPLLIRKLTRFLQKTFTTDELEKEKRRFSELWSHHPKYDAELVNSIFDALTPDNLIREVLEKYQNPSGVRTISSTTT